MTVFEGDVRGGGGGGGGGDDDVAGTDISVDTLDGRGMLGGTYGGGDCDNGCFGG